MKRLRSYYDPNVIAKTCVYSAIWSNPIIYLTNWHEKFEFARFQAVIEIVW